MSAVNVISSFDYIDAIEPPSVTPEDLEEIRDLVEHAIWNDRFKEMRRFSLPSVDQVRLASEEYLSGNLHNGLTELAILAYMFDVALKDPSLTTMEQMSSAAIDSLRYFLGGENNDGSITKQCMGLADAPVLMQPAQMGKGLNQSFVYIDPVKKILLGLGMGNNARLLMRNVPIKDLASTRPLLKKRIIYRDKVDLYRASCQMAHGRMDIPEEEYFASLGHALVDQSVMFTGASVECLLHIDPVLAAKVKVAGKALVAVYQSLIDPRLFLLMQVEDFDTEIPSPHNEIYYYSGEGNDTVGVRARTTLAVENLVFSTV